ncbi:LysM peptidoglycan-binding domain-containing protein [Flavobacterium arcticum]|uniref:LysM peptidoglycan-binding domain-containing protein n=1 Tax=Flavobacterium arcticum TaxID=1784713 RepID=A0A345HER6_9FLAO|nr:LysM domain-containing protein [Flavobacterium arcticum]AXG75076.1 LysM peptidoglycan-binding domain-containing protein [Flavobacterium arcticum]KAF2511143.1 LysM peptidoglycan-binding domain-containing protein [Flavobacterium arcticum]
MKKNLVALLAFGLMFSNGAFAQESHTVVSEKQETEEVINHRVTLGETVALIARRYVIRPSDIYELNPDAVEGIAPGVFLRIPIGRSMSTKGSKKTKQSVKSKRAVVQQSQPMVLPVEKDTLVVVDEVIDDEIAQIGVEETLVEVAPVVVPYKPVALPENGVFEVKHQVVSGETLTSLGRRYNTTITAIMNANEAKLRNGLKIGQELTIPAGPTPETLDGVIVHEVKSGETLIGLSRQYNTTIEEITEYNKRKLRHGLQAGQKLSIMPGQHD